MTENKRLQRSISEEVENLLNEQIKREAFSSSAYLAMSAWCERHGFDNSGDYFLRQSDEERAHMLKIFKYIADMGGKPISPEINKIPHEFKSFKAVFEQALLQEVAVTKSINDIVDACYKAKDYATINFLQWFLEEQREEEYIARRAVELFDVIGEDGIGQYMIDEKVSKLTYDSKGDQPATG